MLNPSWHVTASKVIDRRTCRCNEDGTDEDDEDDDNEENVDNDGEDDNEVCFEVCDFTCFSTCSFSFHKDNHLFFFDPQ